MTSLASPAPDAAGHDRADAARSAAVAAAIPMPSGACTPRPLAPGWNLAVVLATVVLPFALVAIEWSMRMHVCEARADAHCHALAFFAPTLTAAALALFIPCMLMPLAGKAAHQDTPNANGAARRIVFFDLAISYLAGILTLAIFVMWLVVLRPLDDARFAEVWGLPEFSACLVYALAGILTFFKFSLELRSS